jgi:hypothetical protein
MRNERVRILAIGLLLMCCGACSPVAIISYRQFGACGSDHKALVFFSLLQLENASGTAPATFDPYASFVQGHQNDGQGLGFIDLGTTGQLSVNLGFPAAEKVTAAAGQTVTLNTIGVAPVATTAADAATEANNTPYFLVASGALGDKLNANQTSWPVTPSCQDVNIKNGGQ